MWSMNIAKFDAFIIRYVLNFIQKLRARIISVKLYDLSDSRKKLNEGRQHLQIDNFALISEIWNKFIENSQHCYKPNAHVIIDEQIFPTKAKCKFMQYMPNKPDKYGMKAWLVSVTTKYLINGFSYLRINENRIFNST
ncbi:piggyBac transposable element-derived protein 4-like [Vespula squamosa]|uniref:PiggyBac transposable element-derived protein 4-like n=1 Tax=Vespula squamosa TaxID=30214 RepID=A0ABD2BWP5_VESSQ